MVELRWAVPAGTTTKAPRLQYRQLPSVVTFGGPGWSEWQDVPWVVVPEVPQPPATGLSALGVPASPRINPLCGVHGPIPCEGAGCICTRGVPVSDPTQPCLMQSHTLIGPAPTMTYCQRCKNPHHACDGGVPSPIPHPLPAQANDGGEHG